MGYVHDTDMSQFIPPGDFEMLAGTWTMSAASDLVHRARSAADAVFTALIPLPILGNSTGIRGAFLKSIDVWYEIGTAAADDFATVELIKLVLAADDIVPVASKPAITLDAAHDTAAERRAVDNDHRMTITLNTPVWVLHTDAYWLSLVVDCAATTVFKFYGARVNFDLRM